MNSSVLVQSPLPSNTFQSLDLPTSTPSLTSESQPNSEQSQITNKIHEINTFVSKLLDNALEEHQNLTGNTDPTHSTSREARDSRTQETVLVEDSTDSECSSRSAPSPSLGNDGEESIENPESCDEEERVTVESEVSECPIQEVLELNYEKIDYGANFPGMVLEEYLEITNKSDREMCVELSVSCANKECQGLEGYVYSVRSIHYYDASDRHEVVIRPQSTVAYKVILKAPKLKIKDEIVGEVLVSAKGAIGIKKVALSSTLYIPKIVCPKELYSIENKCSVVKLAIKKGKKLETKFSLKNLSEAPVFLNLSFYQPKDLEEENPIEFTLFPNAVNIPANGMAVINMSVKNPKVLAKRTEKDGNSCKKVMIGTVRNCALIYSFSLWIELHD